MRLATHVLLALNRFSPRPHFPARETPDAYANWEYDEARYQSLLMERAGVSLAVPRVLDVGCGLGGKTVYFAERETGHVLGIDRSEANIRAARRFAEARRASRAEFAVADATRIPVQNATFDLVITTDTFEHFTDAQGCLSEMSRVLKPGGRVVALFGPFGSPLGSHLYDSLFVPWCHVFFSRDALAEALRDIARHRHRGQGPGATHEATRWAEEKIRYFDQDLNRMTLRRFRRIVSREPGLVLRRWEKWTPPKLRAASLLVRIPGLDELLTGLLVMVAERVQVTDSKTRVP
jgi:ubiquinone/menaquinone biosynthesis C-methylase UbiE